MSSIQSTSILVGDLAQTSQGLVNISNDQTIHSFVRYHIADGVNIVVPNGSFYYVKRRGLRVKGRGTIRFKGNSICKLER